MSNIFTTLLGILKVVMPFLRTAAERAFKKLPKGEQDKLIQVSKLVEVVKQYHGNYNGIIEAIEPITGISLKEAEVILIDYLKAKGIYASSLYEALTIIWEDASKSTETGVKLLWSGLSNIVSSIVSNVDWQALLMGLGEFVYRSFVKGKIKI